MHVKGIRNKISGFILLFSSELPKLQASERAAVQSPAASAVQYGERRTENGYSALQVGESAGWITVSNSPGSTWTPAPGLSAADTLPKAQDYKYSLWSLSLGIPNKLQNNPKPGDILSNRWL